MSYYNSEQAAQLQDIGQYLQQQRITQKFTLEDIADQTFIRLTVLESLENGNIDQLPERVYVQGFIRRYADLLGINGEELVKTLSEIPDHLPESVSGKNTDQLEKYIESSLSTSKKTQTQTLPPPSPSKHSQSASKATIPQKKGNPLLILLGLAILAGLGAYWYLFRTPSSPELTVKEESEESVEISPKTELSPSPSPVASVTPSPSPSPSPVASVTPSPSPVVSPATSMTPLSLKAVATADTWLSVTADGKEVYAGILKEGEEQQWKADKTIEIRTGNAGGIKLGMNDAPLEPLGELGEVKEATFKAETLQ